MSSPDLTNLTGTPYYFGSAEGEAALQRSLSALSDRMELLRSQGTLTEATLLAYYGQRRFEHIAESNAIEGSTLSVGETELAVSKGITISGHDPSFSCDAQALARALDEITEMAKLNCSPNIEQAKRLNELILGDRPDAGAFRTQPIRIRGVKHIPPKTWREVMDAMEQWEKWSGMAHTTHPLLRACVLHAWLAHIHPFGDGNGRTSRAVMNLELIRAGYPPIIVRLKDRDHYLEALSRSDEGDLSDFIELIGTRLEDSLRDLERAAAKQQGYDPLRLQLIKLQANRLAVWNAGVHLLCASLRGFLQERLAETTATLIVREYDDLDVESFMELCEGRIVARSWAFEIYCEYPGLQPVKLLAWAGYLCPALKAVLVNERTPGRPALVWSVPNPDGFPRWRAADGSGPVCDQLTIRNDQWLCERNGKITEFASSELARLIADEVVEQLLPGSGL